jgi:hypothetical protein
MDQPSFSEFEAAARREGDDEVVARDWPAGAAPHADRYGAAGATYWAARRHATG